MPFLCIKLPLALAFDFWISQFLGTVESVPFRALPQGERQVVGLRPLQDHPQVLGTDRPVGQGAHEIDRAAWKVRAERRSPSPGLSRSESLIATPTP